jgi:hypothetical protein
MGSHPCCMSSQVEWSEKSNNRKYNKSPCCLVSTCVNSFAVSYTNVVCVWWEEEKKCVNENIVGVIIIIKSYAWYI